MREMAIYCSGNNFLFLSDIFLYFIGKINESIYSESIHAEDVSGVMV